MSSPQELHLSFRHLTTDYDIKLVKGGESAHSVEINGVRYAIMGNKEKLNPEKLNKVCEILKSVSLVSISNSEDLRGRLSLRGDISFPHTQKTSDIGPKTLKTSTAAPVAEMEVKERSDLPGISRVSKYIDVLRDSDFYSGIVLVAVGDKIIKEEAIRPKGLKQSEFTHETPFNILSIGKLFTTVAIMQLVEEGAINLDQPIYKLLKIDDYTLKGCDKIYERGRLGKGDLESFMKDSKITIRHLLTHTAGLIPEQGADTPATYDPAIVGKKYNYSNLGFQLLARIVKNKNKEGLSFQDYIRDHIMKASGITEEGSIKYLGLSVAEQERFLYEHPQQFSNGRPSGIPREVEGGLHRIPDPDGNGCFWMTASDLHKFASAFATNKLLKDPSSKEQLLTKDPKFANKALGFQVDGDGTEKNPRRMIHPGMELGASSGLCIIDGREPITLICLSNLSQGFLALPELWDSVIKEETIKPFEKEETIIPFEGSEVLRNQYRTLLSLDVHDSKGIKEIVDRIAPKNLAAVLIELEENKRYVLIAAIVVRLTISNIAQVAEGLTEASKLGGASIQYSLKQVKEAQEALI